jgi:hypothetical protein
MLRLSTISLKPALAAAIGMSLLSCGWAGTSAAAATSPNPAQIQIKPGTTKPSTVGAVGAPSGASVQVLQPPIGLSLEYPLMAQYLGGGPCPPSALVSELQELGSPAISLAGNSQDLTAPSGALTTPIPDWDMATLYSLPEAFWSQLHCLLTATKESLTVGLNAKLGNLAWAQQMAAGALSAATNGLSFALGNEPDLYYLPNYGSLGQRSYNEEEAVSIYLGVAGYLAPAVGTNPVVGPELAIASNWLHQLPRVISALHIKTVGVHLYPLSACGSPKAVTIARLLSPTAADAPSTLGWVVTDANAAGADAILSESNSAACGGLEGVSNAPASAVWAVRFVLSALKVGFQQVRFHASGGPYDPFVVEGAQVVLRPLAIAMAALARWLPVGATLQTLRSPDGIVATAISGGQAPVQVICDNETAHARILELPGGESLHAEVLTATSPKIVTVTAPLHHGHVLLRLPANSVAAVLATT